MSRLLVMLPPADELIESWAAAVAKAAPGLEVVSAPDRAAALISFRLNDIVALWGKLAKSQALCSRHAEGKATGRVGSCP